MSQPFIGMVTAFAGNFAPRGWMLCQGQLLPIAQYNALFAILGTTYGGNGTTNFGLPNLAGRMPMGIGNGPGLSPRVLGEIDGQETHQLTISELPAHNHLVTAIGSSPAKVGSPSSSAYLGAPGRAAPIYSSGTADTTLAPQSIGVTGSSIPHSIMPPVLALTYIIAIEGIFPSRN